jgi:transcriptional regulator with XRE-family HTH domain
MAVASTFPDRLRARRIALRRSIKDVCLQSGVSRSYYYDLEHKRGIRPSADVLERLARVLETTSAALLGPADLPAGAPVGGLPVELTAVVARLHIRPSEARMLSAIRWEGRAPSTEADWLFLAEAVRRGCPE